MYANDDVLLITKEDIFKYTQLSGNFDVDKITPFIKIAQDIQVQELCGTVLYRKLLDDVQSNTLAGDYLLLLFHGYEVTNAGIVRNSPENTQLPSKEELDTIVQRQRNIAETYRRRCVDYLSYFPQRYPEYTANQQAGEYPNSNPSNFVTWNL